MGSKNEDSLSKMGSSEGGSRNSCPARIKPAFGKVSENSSSTPRQQTWDVFNRDVRGSYLAKHAENIVPKPSFVELAESIAGEALRLAGDAGNDKIHSISEEAAVEGSDVVPDWELISELVLSCDENRCAVGLSLDGTDDSDIVEDELKRAFEAADP